MNAEEFSKLLIKLRACPEVIEWAKGKDLQTVWESCQRADWLLWLAGKMADHDGWPTRQQVVLVACSCADTSLKYVNKGELRPEKSIEVARSWAHGHATFAQVGRACSNAYNAAAEAVTFEAHEASIAAVSSGFAVSYAEEAARAARAAAEAAADAAEYAPAVSSAAVAAARALALAEMATLVRNAIPVPFRLSVRSPTVR